MRTRLGKLTVSALAGLAYGLGRTRIADRLESQLVRRIEQSGKMRKREAGYVAAFPPPFFWEYRCETCRFWESGFCSLVAGRVSKTGWCTLWLPPGRAEKPLTWVRRANKMPALMSAAFKDLLTDPETEG